MRIFHNRPLAMAECIFALFAVVALGLEPKWKWIVLSLSLLCALSFFILSFCPHGKFCLSRRFLTSVCFLAVALALLGNVIFFEHRRAEVA